MQANIDMLAELYTGERSSTSPACRTTTGSASGSSYKFIGLPAFRFSRTAGPTKI